MIVDAHCHAGRGNVLDAPWHSAPLGAYLRRAAVAGIRRTLVFAPFADDTATANRNVAGIVAHLPDRLTGVAWINPRRDRGQIDDLVAEAVLNYGFRGIKVHRA